MFIKGSERFEVFTFFLDSLFVSRSDLLFFSLILDTKYFLDTIPDVVHHLLSGHGAGYFHHNRVFLLLIHRVHQTGEMLRNEMSAVSFIVNIVMAPS